MATRGEENCGAKYNSNGGMRQSPNNSADDGDLDLSQYDIPNIPTELLLEHAGAEKIKLDGLNPMRK